VDAREWSWDAAKVCTLPDTTDETLACLGDEFTRVMHDVQVMHAHARAQAASVMFAVQECMDFVTDQLSKLHARVSKHQSFGQRSQQLGQHIHQLQMHQIHRTSFAEEHSIPSIDRIAAIFRAAVTSSTQVCTRHPPLRVLQTSELQPRLLGPMPSLLTPNASQHPDTDEIVYLLQHLGPWCDAGRSYPEAMGGLQALGGALRRRYSRGGARLLLQYQYSTQRDLDWPEFDGLSQMCRSGVAGMEENTASQARTVARLQQVQCQREAYAEAINAHVSQLEDAIQEAGPWDLFILSEPPLFVPLWLHTEHLRQVHRMRQMLQWRPSSSTEQHKQGQPLSGPSPPALPVYVLDAQGQVRVLIDARRSASGHEEAPTHGESGHA